MDNAYGEVRAGGRDWREEEVFKESIKVAITL